MMPFPLPAMCVSPVPSYLSLPGLELPPFSPNALPSIPANLVSLIFPLWEGNFLREDIELWAYTLHYQLPSLQIWFDVTDLPVDFYFVEGWYGSGAFRYKAGKWEVYSKYEPDKDALIAFETWRLKHARLSFS